MSLRQQFWLVLAAFLIQLGIAESLFAQGSGAHPAFVPEHRESSIARVGAFGNDPFLANTWSSLRPVSQNPSQPKTGPSLEPPASPAAKEACLPPQAAPEAFRPDCRLFRPLCLLFTLQPRAP